MANVRVVTDSACDLPEELARELGIVIIPLTIRFAEEEFVDRSELDTEQFWTRSAASSHLPSTAAPAPGLFEVAFRTAATEGADGVVCITLSGGLSATMQSAELGARAASDAIDVRVVDSKSVSIGLGMIAVACARAAAAGSSLDDIERLATSLAPRTRVWAALDTLDNLKKGGRIGGAKALVASVLSIKPIIKVIDGVVEEGGRQRTRTKALNFLIDQLRAAGPIDNLAVMHARCDDVEAFVQRVREATGLEPVIGEIGAVIGAHAGLGTIGVVYQER